MGRRSITGLMEIAHHRLTEGFVYKCSSAHVNYICVVVAPAVPRMCNYTLFS